MNVQEINLSEIKPYFKNARINDKTIPALKESITRFGFNNPLILDKDNVIICGHARYKALTELGKKTASCVVVDLPAEKVKEYRIADNKTSELAQWDGALLMTEMRELTDIQFMQNFFPTVDLNSWINVSVGQEVKPITDSDLSKENGSTQRNIEESTSNAHSDLLDFECPACFEKMSVSRADVLRRLDRSETEDKRFESKN